jgi:hypothetical protein
VNGGFFTPTLTITAASTASGPPKANPVYPIAGFLLAACAYAIMRPRRRALTPGFALLLLVCLSGCRGGSSSYSNSASTGVAESGAVTVVATSGSISHSTAVSVSIQ